MDFNKDGVKYEFVAFKKDPQGIQKEEGYGLIDERAVELLTKLRHNNSKAWSKASSADEKKLTGKLIAALDRLSAFLYVARTFPIHQENLCKIQIQEGMMLGLRGEQVCTDFESLLFHGRACLDSVSHYISTGIFNQRSD